ncbi:MAG: hypothetical protein KQ78_01985 [Candidatus Izimaplasma bacterium HR2]|nr:MAG: hypothetical protein KQ78_01985 [Candidatus Izimaplasma bacterium HR2]
MAKLRTIKGKTKVIPKRKENAVKTQSDWGRGCKDETCFTVFKSGNHFLIASPLKIMSKPGINSFKYIIEEMLDFDFDVVIDMIINRFNAEIIINSKFRYLQFNIEQDARKCKNLLNKLLREM